MSEAEAKLWQEYVGTRDRLVELKAQLAKTCFADAVKSPQEEEGGQRTQAQRRKNGESEQGQGKWEEDCY